MKWTHRLSCELLMCFANTFNLCNLIICSSCCESYLGHETTAFIANVTILIFKRKKILASFKKKIVKINSIIAHYPLVKWNPRYILPSNIVNRSILNGRCSGNNVYCLHSHCRFAQVQKYVIKLQFSITVMSLNVCRY